MEKGGRERKNVHDLVSYRSGCYDRDAGNAKVWLVICTNNMIQNVTDSWYQC